MPCPRRAAAAGSWSLASHVLAAIRATHAAKREWTPRASCLSACLGGGRTSYGTEDDAAAAAGLSGHWRSERQSINRRPSLSRLSYPKFSPRHIRLVILAIFSVDDAELTDPCFSRFFSPPSSKPATFLSPDLEIYFGPLQPNHPCLSYVSSFTSHHYRTYCSSEPTIHHNSYNGISRSRCYLRRSHPR